MDVHDTTVIILAYNRYQNISLQVRSILRHPRISRVIVSINNVSRRFPRSWRVVDPRVRYIDQPVMRTTLSRYHIALREAGDKFLFLDDDVFITPAQIDALLCKLDEDPEVPHGVVGQIYDPWMDRMHSFVRGHEGPADVVNCVYALTKTHLTSFFQLLQRLEIGPAMRTGFPPIADDMILSHTGSGKPILHSLGPLLCCPTSSMQGIAAYTAGNFFRYRMRLFKELRSLIAS